MEYKDYLLSDDWKIRRECRLQMDGFECALCGSSEKLNVHHKHYHNIFHEDVRRDLITLCQRCHSAYHGKGNPVETMDESLDSIGVVDYEGTYYLPKSHRDIIEILEAAMSDCLDEWEAGFYVPVPITELHNEQIEVLIGLYQRDNRDKRIA